MEYSLKRNARTRRMSITINRFGGVVVKLPPRTPSLIAHMFVKSKELWILHHQAAMKTRLEDTTILDQSHQDFLQNKRTALKFLEERVKYFNEFYNFSIGTVHVGNQKSRWGSCTKTGNLSFNYGLIKIPQELADYVVVHELCHIKHFNHSKKFWGLVGTTLPNYKILRKELKEKYMSIK